MNDPLRRRPCRAATPPALASDRAALHSVRGRRPENDERALVRPELGLYAVADGLGGAHGGARAATLAIEALAAHYAPVAAETFTASAEALGARLSEAVRAANDAVRRARSGAFTAMGSTLVALARSREHVAIAHVGDSRAMRLDSGRVVTLTADHSMRSVLVGRDASGAFLARYGHLVTRALGCPTRELDLELRVDSLAHEAGCPVPQRYLLASDGLTEWIGAGELAASLAIPSARDAARALVGHAIRSGSDDSATALVLDLCRSRGPARP